MTQLCWAPPPAGSTCKTPGTVQRVQKPPNRPSLELSVSLGQVEVKERNEDTRELSHISLSPCSLLLLFIQLYNIQIPHSLIPFQVQRQVGILKESVPFSCLVFLSGHSCHLKAAKRRANGNSVVTQVVERDQNCSVVSGSNQPTMKQKKVMIKPLLGMSSCLHIIFSN